MKILVGYRGLNVGKDLLELAAKHAKAFSAEVILITSLPGGDKTTSEHVYEAEEKLGKAKEFFNNLGITNETHLLVRGKTAGEDIVAFASDKGCDEILIGVKSRSKVGKILFGSTAQFVILNSDCPVISIK
jgi:nucleotide-binding universal stress UspA family protein